MCKKFPQGNFRITFYMWELITYSKRKNNKKKPLIHEEKAVKRLTTSKQYDKINLPQFKKSI